jgi:hypothetical protein
VSGLGGGVAVSLSSPLSVCSRELASFAPSCFHACGRPCSLMDENKILRLHLKQAGGKPIGSLRPEFELAPATDLPDEEPHEDAEAAAEM